MTPKEIKQAKLKIAFPSGELATFLLDRLKDIAGYIL